MSIYNNFDIIIIGSGVSGLILANEIIERTNKRILLLEKRKKIPYDKNICFWNLPNNILSNSADSKWNRISVNIDGEKFQFEEEGILYQRLKSKTIFDFFIKKLEKKKKFRFLMGQKIKSIKSRDKEIYVNSGNEIFKSTLLFDSRLNKEDIVNNKLKQHFYGAEVCFESSILNKDEIIFMDVLKYENLFNFMYILPFSQKRMLIETTYFSTILLPDEVYKKDIKDYLDKNYYGKKYKINFFESGIIPMFKLKQSNMRNCIRIGVSGNWAKLSTGYSLQNSFVHSRQIVDCILKKQYPSIHKKSICNFLDETFCKFIKNDPNNSALFFKEFFKNNNLKTIVNFLTDSASLLEIIKIIFSLPKIALIKSIFYNK